MLFFLSLKLCNAEEGVLVNKWAEGVYKSVQVAAYFWQDVCALRQQWMLNLALY